MTMRRSYKRGLAQIVEVNGNYQVVDAIQWRVIGEFQTHTQAKVACRIARRQWKEMRTMPRDIKVGIDEMSIQDIAAMLSEAQQSPKALAFIGSIMAHESIDDMIDSDLRLSALMRCRKPKEVGAK